MNINEHQHKASITSDAGRLEILDKFIGDLPLDTINMGTLQTYIATRRANKKSSRTINHGLKIVRRIANLAATEWMDENGLTWLANAPKIKLLPEHDLRKPYPLSWKEQEKLFEALPKHLSRMALFAVNTGCRDKVICSLKWRWEVQLPEIGGSVFIVPGDYVKNREDRLVVLNSIARSVVEEVRGSYPEYVFTFRGKPNKRILNSGWRKAREKAGLSHVRVHDLKHTFGRRLRAAGVSFEDRQDLLGHKSGRITTHYSAAEISSLLHAAEKVCRTYSSSPALTILRAA